MKQRTVSCHFTLGHSHVTNGDLLLSPPVETTALPIDSSLEPEELEVDDTELSESLPMSEEEEDSETGP